MNESEGCGGGGSLSRIVPVAGDEGRPAPEAFDRVTVYVSFGSSATSPTTWTVMVFCDSPTAKVSVPLVGWKSTPDWAVPDPVANCTVTVPAAGGVSVTVKTWL